MPQLQGMIDFFVSLTSHRQAWESLVFSAPSPWVFLLCLVSTSGSRKRDLLLNRSLHINPCHKTFVWQLSYLDCSYRRCPTLFKNARKTSDSCTLPLRGHLPDCWSLQPLSHRIYDMCLFLALLKCSYWWECPFQFVPYLIMIQSDGGHLSWQPWHFVYLDCRKSRLYRRCWARNWKTGSLSLGLLRLRAPLGSSNSKSCTCCWKNHCLG